MLAVLHGIRVPGLEVVLSVLATWALLVIGAITAAELLRRHHRALARHAARHGKRGALFTARHGRRGALAAGRGARRGSRSAAGYLARKAAARWQNREHRPLMFHRTRPGGPAPQTPAGTRARRPRPSPCRCRPHRPAPPVVPDPPPPEGKTTMADTIVTDDTTRARRPRRPDHAGAPGPAHRGPDRRGRPGRMGRGDRPRR